MDAETREKIKKTVREILEEADMDEMTEYKIRQMASQKLELNLSDSSTRLTSDMSSILSSKNKKPDKKKKKQKLQQMMMMIIIIITTRRSLMAMVISLFASCLRKEG